MRIFYLLLLSVFSLVLTQPVLSQTMSNTDNVITLTNTCINGGLSSGTYNLILHHVSEAGDITQNIPGVAVVLNGGVLTITDPASSFPTIAKNGVFSLAETYNGDITLSSGSFATYMNWSQNPDFSYGFNCVALPVYFSSFTGVPLGSSVALNWQTSTESNISAIEVYRSSTGSSYYKIGQVTPAGAPHSYSFTDNNPDASNFYYLKMVSSVGLQGIYSTTVHVNCASCHYTPPTAVNCPYTISGPDHICNLQSFGAYTLSTAVPNYSTISWSVDQPSVAALHVYESFDRTKASLLRKSVGGAVVLTATLSGCSNVITKTVAIGLPDPVITGDLVCPYLNVNMSNAPGATNYSWYFIDVATNATESWPSWGANQFFVTHDGDEFYVGGLYTNACGTSNEVFAYGFWCDPGGGGGWDPPGDGFMAVSPNPSKGIVNIGLAATQASKTNNLKATAAVVKPKVYQVRIVDVQGIVRKTFTYPGGVERISADLSGLNNGLYIIQVFDSRIWRSTKVVLNK